MRTVVVWSSALVLVLAPACATRPPPPVAPVGAIVSGGSVPPPAPSVPPVASEEEGAVPVSTGDPAWGSREAPVTLVVFGDFQCPYTSRVFSTFRQLQTKYGPRDLRIVWKDEPLPFHPNARPAAEAAATVFKLGGSDAFWKFSDLALAHQAELTAQSFEAWAAASGVDMPSFSRMVAAHDGAARVDAGNALATRLHAEGTPTSFINGVLLTGAQGPDKFSAIIDAELAKGRARLAAGVAPDKLYATLATENWKAPQDEPDDDEKEDTTTVWNVPVSGAPVRGRASAPVTIVEFSDYQCPYCKRVEPTLKQVVSTYGDKVRIVWRDEPLSFHPRALPAAELAREARAEKGEAGFWAAHDALFDSQPALADADLDRIARALGLDAGRARTAIDKSRYQAQIDRDGDLADDLEANGTPHFFVNGRRLVGAQPFEKFAALIDEELHHADALVAKGTPPGAVYETIIKAGKGPPPPATLAVQPRTGAPWKGSRTGKVVIEEFADFQCPFCARAEPTLQRIAKDYGTQVKFVWRNLPLPFHTHAMPAAEAAAEAQRQKGNAGFWAMHDKLFAHQGDHDGDGSGLERAALEAYAGELGLDLPAFKNALDNHTHKPELDADHDAVQAAHVEGAPTFVVGGYVVSGAQPYGKFRRIIEQVLASGPGKP